MYNNSRDDPFQEVVQQTPLEDEFESAWANLHLGQAEAVAATAARVGLIRDTGYTFEEKDGYIVHPR